MRDCSVRSKSVVVEVAVAQAEEDCSVELGVSADEVLLVGLVGGAVLVVPELV